jgi:hypothetical protein
LYVYLSAIGNAICEGENVLSSFKLHQIKDTMTLKTLLQDAFLWLQIFIGAIIVGGTVYQMMVIVPEFNRDIPNGMISFAHSQMETGNFWVSPILIVSLLLPVIALILNWKTKRKKWLLLAFIFNVASMIFTIIYFGSRLKIMGLIDHNPSTDVALLTQTIREWVTADQFRFWLTIVPPFFFALKAATISLKQSSQPSMT